MLDESAIEAMIARQREVMNTRHETAPSVRTVQTDEFEVYERPAEPKPTPEPQAPAAPTAPAAPAQEEEFEVFERTPTPQPAPEPAHQPSPAPPQPIPYPNQEPAPEPEPTPTPRSEAPRPFAPQPTRRPEVWPPIGARAASAVPPAPTATAAPAAPEPDVSPRTHAPDTAPTAPRAAPESTGHAFPDLSGSTGGSSEVPRLAIVQALFNEEITGDMLGLARQKADRLGAPVVQHVTVPGVYDLPLAVQALLRRDDVDAVVVLGCVVTGETRHDEVITHATAKSLQEVSLAAGKPVGFGVIGPGMTWKQAEARVVNGKHAVEAAVAQWRVLRGLTA